MKNMNNITKYRKKIRKSVKKNDRIKTILVITINRSTVQTSLSKDKDYHINSKSKLKTMF